MHVSEELSIKAMTVNQIFSLYISKKLIVNRKYQRKLCWTIEEKRNFIDTILNGYPVPLFLLAINEDGDYEIIDGMQRLDAICTLIEQKYELMEGYFNLESMPDTIELLRTGKMKQKKAVITATRCKDIANYPLPVSIFSARDNKIEEVFKRINSTGKHLSAQELRQIGVNTDFATLVRHISSKIRGDDSDDVLLLNNMSNISLSNYRLKYTININNIFWVKNEIINSNDLRLSRDEEVVGYILSNLLLGNDLNIQYSGSMLNKLYGYSRNPLSLETPAEMTAIQNAIDRIGYNRVKMQFQSVLSCIKDALSYSKTTFRNLLRLDRSISDISLQFQVIFMAIYRIMIEEGRMAYNVKKIVQKLDGNCTSISTVSIRTNKKLNPLVDMIYGLITEAFTNSGMEDPAKDNWTNDCIGILNRSRTEQVLYDFKIGFVDYMGNKINTKVIDKVLKTLTAINNVGPNKKGYVIIGVADTEEDADKYCKIDNMDYYMEGDFPIVGVDHDAKATGMSIDIYTHSIKEYIKSNKNINEEYCRHLLINMKTPVLYGRQLILFKTNYDRPVIYDNKYYIREFTDVHELNISQYEDLFSNYYKISSSGITENI